MTKIETGIPNNLGKNKNDIKNNANKKIANDAFYKVHNIQRTSTFDCISSWKEFCRKTSMHGLQYLVDKDISIWERGIWIVILSSILLMLCFSILLLDFSYKTNNLLSTVENYTYSVENIPFPAVSICPKYEFDWTHFEDIIMKYVSEENFTNRTKIEIIKNFIGVFENFHYGKFSAFQKFKENDIMVLENIDMQELLRDLLISCNSIFEECFVEGLKNDCCKIFTPQNTKYGQCYTFNSILNDEGRDLAKIDLNYPMRTKYSGKQNGIKVKLKSVYTKLINSEGRNGYYVMIHHPEEWTGQKTFVPAGSSYSVSISPEIFNAMVQIKKLPTSQRLILFEDEINDPMYRTLPGLRYSWKNCMDQCHQEFLIKNCNCTLDMLFPVGEYPTCKPSQFQCLANIPEFNSMTSGRNRFSENSIDDNVYMENKLHCYCLKNSSTLNYIYHNENLVPILSTHNPNKVEINVYFHRSTFLKFQTSLERNWFDFLIYYGGLGSFFLGISVTTFIEFIYFCFIRIFFKNRRREQLIWDNYEKKKNIFQNINYNLNVIRKSRDVNTIDAFNTNDYNSC